MKEERLRELGILANNPGEQLSREPAHDWMVLVEDDDGSLAAELATQTAANYQALTHCVC